MRKTNKKTHASACFRDEPVTEISLKSYANSREVKAGVDKIVQKGGLSNVGE